MTRQLCHGLSAICVETEHGRAIRPCPWCRRSNGLAAEENPYLATLDVARTVAAEDPNASDDEIARRLHGKLKDMRLLVRKGDNYTMPRDVE